jgi:beta-lactam-binding protein with PASTA domain
MKTTTAIGAVTAIAFLAGLLALAVRNRRADTSHVPYVVGMTQTNALKALEAAHVRWRFGKGGVVFSHPRGGLSAGDKDLVIHQSPGSGTRTSASTVVTLSLCSIDPTTGCIDARVTGHTID